MKYYVYMMDEIEYKLESTNPVLISHVSYSLFHISQLNVYIFHLVFYSNYIMYFSTQATSKLFESIKKKKCDRQTDHISKVKHVFVRLLYDPIHRFYFCVNQRGNINLILFIPFINLYRYPSLSCY